jgi:hypothetical protein
MLYPLLLVAFHDSVTGALSTASGLAWASAACSLVLAFLAPMVALAMAKRLSANQRPTVAELLARRIALLAVAAPPIYTFLGVISFMLGVAAADIWAFWILWGILTVAVVLADNQTPATSAPVPAKPGIRIAHGVTALALLLVFLGAHVVNHFFGLVGAEAHAVVMKALRQIYRQPVVEPLVVAGFLFQVISGGYLAWRLTATATDGFRTLQVASGVFLMIFTVSHINAVLVLARSYLNIDSDWGFATGAPTGLIRDAWNIRLVPLYGLAVFFVLSHLVAGARIVMLAHGANRKQADRAQVWGTAVATLSAIVILCGMCGVRLHVG